MLPTIGDKKVRDVLAWDLSAPAMDTKNGPLVFLPQRNFFWLYSPIPPLGIEADNPKFLIEILDFKRQVPNLAALIHHASRSY